MITTECAKCIHDEVCGLKECVKEAEEKANESKVGLIHPDIEIMIKCRKYKEKLEKEPFTYADGVRQIGV